MGDAPVMVYGQGGPYVQERRGLRNYFQRPVWKDPRDPTLIPAGFQYPPKKEILDYKVAYLKSDIEKDTSDAKAT